MARGRNSGRGLRQLNTSEARRQAFGAALAKRRKELQLSQTALGRALGGIAQSAVSQWECGETEPRAEHVYAAENALGLTPGTLSRMLGYLPPSSTKNNDPGSFREAVRRDPLLTDEEKRSFLVLYNALTGGRSARLKST
jgi:transcriptional regulator with XRE-family HTH domain